MSGWIKLHRQIQGHWLWLSEKPFDKRSAWIDILLMVNHEDKKILLGNELIEVKRGSRVTSIRQLCDRWGWSNTKVKNFLNLLEKDDMLVVKSDSKKTTLTVVNYSGYQDWNDAENDTKTTVTFSGSQKNVKKNDTKTTAITPGNTGVCQAGSNNKRRRNDAKATRKHTNNNDNNDNKYIDDDEESDEKNPYVFYENNFGTLSSFVAERIKALEEDIGSEMVIEAMKIAQLNRATSFKYVEAVAKNWLAKNIRTPEDIKAIEEEKQRPKPSKNQDQPLDIDYEAAKKSKYGW